jgi:LysM repeat protein
MVKKIGSLLLLFFSVMAMAQNYSNHKVLKGETVTSIAQKYKVTPYDIYRLNPDVQNGIKENMVLLIPSLAVVKTTTNAVVSHQVLPKETLYSIAKQYNTTIDAIENANPTLKTEGLKIGQTLSIPSKQALPEATIISHQVQPKETKYGIASKYGITVEELEKQNPEIKEGLPIGIVLKINKKADSSTTTINEPTDTVVKPTETAVVPKNNYEYTVLAGETFYSLTRKFSISQASLIALNPELKDGVKEGMTIKVPASISVKKETQSVFKNLAQSLNKKDKKELVLFLPFNVAKIKSDTTIAVQERIKKDKFLNMTLDFYSGALMAIDSAKALGLNINVKIYDSEETKNFTSATATIQKNNFDNVDAVIGPFYQDNAEKVAAALQSKNIPVISPLSKDEEGKGYPNLFQTMPSNESVKNAMFDYMNTKNGNIIAIIDPKKAGIKQYIDAYQKDTKLVGFSEKGSFVSDSIKKHFVKDKTNFVIMESEKTGTIFTVLNTLSNASKEFQVQLVLLEENKTLNFEEITLNQLTKLKLTYPSVTKDSDSPEAKRFERAYRKKNNILPNDFATRGFDLMLDTMLRLSQGTTFAETTNIATEQIEYKFDYSPKISGGYNNEGVYILYYNTDLTIKQAP